MGGLRMGEAREIEAPSGRLGILMPGMGRERRPPPAFADLVAATSLWVLGFAAVAASSRRSHAGSEALRPRRLLPRPPRSYTPHADETSQDRGCRMDYGVHLPLIDLDGRPWSLQRLLEYVETAEGLGFEAVCANDHLVFSRPWLDGHTALAAVLAATGKMDLMTTVALPVVRGPSAGEEPGRHRHPHRQSSHRGSRSRFLRPGLRRRWYPLRGTLEAPGRGGGSIARPLA